MASLVFTSKSFKYLIRCEHAALWPDVSGVYARVRLAHSGLWAHLGGGGIAPLQHRGAPPARQHPKKRRFASTWHNNPPTHTPCLYHWDFFFAPERRGGARWGSVPPVCPGPRAWHGRGGRRGGPGCSPGRARTQVVNVAGTKQQIPPSPSSNKQPAARRAAQNASLTVAVY